MADAERTHPATPKRIREFRKRGDIALSRELVSAAAMIGAVGALLASSGMAASALISLTRDAALATDGRNTHALAGDALRTFLVASAPPLAGAAAVALIAILMQLGWPPAFKGIKLDLGRLSPLSNLRQAFGGGAMARRTASAVAKLVVVGAIVTFALHSVVTTHAVGAGELGAIAWSSVTRALLIVMGALAAIAAVDYWLARRRISTQMKMSAEEIKREHKESEGDPQQKGRRRARMRELAKRRIHVTVPTADVIVVNPTHYAVALRYDEKTDSAPLVVAKGVDEVAEKIREIARKHGVPVLSRPPLARALHKHVKEGRTVPSNLYKAVAEVLAYVYRLRAGAA